MPVPATRVLVVGRGRKLVSGIRPVRMRVWAGSPEEHRGVDPPAKVSAMMKLRVVAVDRFVVYVRPMVQVDVVKGYVREQHLGRLARQLVRDEDFGGIGRRRDVPRKPTAVHFLYTHPVPNAGINLCLRARNVPDANVGYHASKLPANLYRRV